jgi:predicted transcriptional regulator
MAQITLYLDDDLAKRLQAAAQAADLSRSRWVADLIAAELRDTWPDEVVALAGAWPDLPEAETLRAEMGRDATREPIA